MKRLLWTSESCERKTSYQITDQTLSRPRNFAFNGDLATILVHGRKKGKVRRKQRGHNSKRKAAERAKREGSNLQFDNRWVCA